MRFSASCSFLLCILCVLCALLGLSSPAPLRAALSDEIQVYTDGIEQPGQFGLEMHLNTPLRGRRTPDFPGEITPHRAWRVTPEFSYGLTSEVDLGLYMPYVRDEGGTWHYAGPKLRLKWLPLQVSPGQHWFAGVNVEYGMIKPEFEQATRFIETRPIVGYRGKEWLLAFNPILGLDLTGPNHDGKPDFAPAFKVARSVAPGAALGIEYYAELGKLERFAPRSEQSHTLYFTLDWDRKPLGFNLGIGRGLNQATDKWTLKAIFEIPMH
jgi:hypothetical protein